MRLPPRARLVMWSLMLVMILAYFFIEPINSKQATTEIDIPPAPAELVPKRLATDEEKQLDIVALGNKALAKRLYFIDTKQRLGGILAWWHDGREERFSYIPGPNEVWIESIRTLKRGLQFREINILNFSGDENIAQRIISMDTLPYDALADGWTLLERD